MLRLRPFKESDIQYMLDWKMDEFQFARWCANLFTYPLTKEQLLEYKNNYDKDEHAWIFTAVDDIGTPVGHFMMRNADYAGQNIRIGFVMIAPDCQGKGYGKEMMRLAVTYATEILKFKKVNLGVFENNPAAHRCYESIGFKDHTFIADYIEFQGEKWGGYEMLYTKE